MDEINRQAHGMHYIFIDKEATNRITQYLLKMKTKVNHMNEI